MSLALILAWYLGLGILAALGAIWVSQQRFSAKVEPVFFGVVLIPIAAIYLAFTAYFGAESSWGLEGIGVVFFALLGVAGIRFPLLLILGYVLHGAWDLFHEVASIAVAVPEATGRITAIPLAYGVFCAAFDWWMAGYFYQRRADWKAAMQ